MNKHPTVSDMVGRTFKRVELLGSNEQLIFVEEDGTRWRFYHDQDCCESVLIEDINGNLEDLVDSPITIAEEASVSPDNEGSYSDSTTWTFYKFATIKGYVDVRWLGQSNGYYSEKVDLEVTKDKP